MEQRIYVKLSFKVEKQLQKPITCIAMLMAKMPRVKRRPTNPSDILQHGRT
jgi:hypothetical protein